MSAWGGYTVKIRFNATMSQSDSNPAPNSFKVHGSISARNFTKEFNYYDENPFIYPWYGRCYAWLLEQDISELTRTDIAKVTVKISLLYANISSMKATGANCDNLRLDAFKSDEEPVVDNSTSHFTTTSYPASLDEQYAKVLS